MNETDCIMWPKRISYCFIDPSNIFIQAKQSNQTQLAQLPCIFTENCSKMICFFISHFHILFIYIPWPNAIFGWMNRHSNVISIYFRILIFNLIEIHDGKYWIFDSDTNIWMHSFLVEIWSPSMNTYWIVLCRLLLLQPSSRQLLIMFRLQKR